MDNYSWLWNTFFYAVEAFAIFGLLLEMSLFTMHLAALIYLKLYINKKPPDLMKAQVKGVSILKPLKGIDPNLEDNLDSLFQLDYPQYEILFCIQAADDPAHELVNRLISKHPGVDAKIVSGGKRSGANPKISNLLPAYDIMKYNFFWICDSGIHVLPLALRDLVSKMTDNVALVHAIPYTCNRKGFSSTVEKIYFGTHHMRIYVSSHILGVTCMTGMSTLLRRDYFEKAVGGLGKLSMYMAEDYFLAKMLAERPTTTSFFEHYLFHKFLEHQKIARLLHSPYSLLRCDWRTCGYKITLASYPALQNSGSYGIGIFIERMKRWTKLRLAMVPLAVILEPFSECFLCGTVFSWACYHYFSWNMLVVFLYHVFIWFAFDYIVFRLLENGHLLLSKCDFLVAWFVRETLTPYVILCALYDPTVSWRSGKFRLRCGGTVEEVLDV